MRAASGGKEMAQAKTRKPRHAAGGQNLRWQRVFG